MPHRLGSLARRRNLRRALLLPVLTLLWLTWPACTGISGGAIVARDPGYLKRNEMEIVRGGGDDVQAVSASSQILAALSEGGLRLRQRPAPKNSLGLVKFIFPNDANVYLHDTRWRNGC